MFLDLASQKELDPEARQLADAVAAANNRQLQDPKRLAGLIKQLQDPAEDVRAQAVAGLRTPAAPASRPWSPPFPAAGRGRTVPPPARPWPRWVPRRPAR